MRKHIPIFLIALLVLSVQNCSTAAENAAVFQMDQIYQPEADSEIHYNLYIPQDYDGSEPYALYIALPGWGGLYFQGVGSDLREPFPYAGPMYNAKMIVVSPQLNDWGLTSAQQTIQLTEYLMSAYAINPDRIYISGYSGGGETLSIVLGVRPDLYAAALHVSSQWDGDLAILAESETPLYLVIGEDDDYYGSDSVKVAYDTLSELYRWKGLSEEQISRLLILDIKDAAWFAARNTRSQHGGGGLAAHEPDIMNWLFRHKKGI